MKRSHLFQTGVLLIILFSSACHDAISPNAPPKAEAGADLFVNVGETVFLDGTRSTDPEGEGLTHGWVFLSTPAGSNAVLGDASTAVASFIPDLGGEYVLQLTVSDGDGTSTDNCTVYANAPPIAKAGTDQASWTGELVQLDGSGSFDPDGDPPTYSWTFQSKPDGSRARISEGAAETGTFTPDLVGTYVVTLTVSDGRLDASDDAEVSVAAGTRPALLIPEPGDTLDNGCFPESDWIEWSFEWSAVPGASVYHLYVLGPTATYPLVNHTIVETEYQYRSLGYIAYHNLSGWTWKARARIDGVWKDWTMPRTFNVEPRDTDCPAPSQEILKE